MENSTLPHDSFTRRNAVHRYIADRYERHYHPRHPHGKKHLMADTALLTLILALGIVSALMLGLVPLMSPKLLSATLEQREGALFSGKDVRFNLVLTNTSQREMRNVSLRLKTPKHFILRSLKIESDITEEETLIISSLPPHHSRTIEITGTPYGAWDTEQVLTAVLTYTHAKGRAGFTAAHLVYHLQGSGFDVRFVLPRIVAPHQRFTGTIIVTNATPYTAENMNASLSYPKGFILDSFQNSTAATTSFSLSPSEQKHLMFTGRFTTETQGEERIEVKIFLTAQDEKFLQEDTHGPISLRVPALDLVLQPADGKSSAHPGRKKNFSLVWNMKDEEAVKDVIAGVKISGDYAKPGSISSPDGLRTNPTTILWSKNHRKEFLKVAQGSHGTFHFSFDVLKNLDLSDLDPQHDYAIKLQPFASYAYSDGTRVESIGAPFTLDVSSQLTVSGAARYFTPEGEQIGRGPLPPRVGKQTKYYVFFLAGTTIHPLENAKITASLPPSVTWAGSVPGAAQAPVFDVALRQIRWTMPHIAPSRDGKTQTDSAVFQLMLTPLAKMRGTNAVLLTDIVATGTDTITGDSVEERISPLTTNLASDRFATGKGVVH